MSTSGWGTRSSTGIQTASAAADVTSNPTVRADVQPQCWPSEIASWAPYLGSGFQAQTYADSQNLFSLGKGAIYAAGSWDISTFRGQAKFAMGAFPPPQPTGTTDCYISDHTDIAKKYDPY